MKGRVSPPLDRRVAQKVEIPELNRDVSVGHSDTGEAKPLPDFRNHGLCQEIYGDSGDVRVRPSHTTWQESAMLQAQHPAHG